jgi:hypothetical protein
VGQRLVLATSCSIGMGSAFDGSPVLSGGEADSIDAVHDSLVVGDGSEGIFHGELVCFNNFLSNFDSLMSFPLHVLDGDGEGAACSAFDAVVAEDGDAGSNAHTQHNFFGPFRDCVDYVGSHRFFHVDQNVQRIVVVAWLFVVEISQTEVFDAAVSSGH